MNWSRSTSTRQLPPSLQRLSHTIHKRACLTSLSTSSSPIVEDLWIWDPTSSILRKSIHWNLIGIMQPNCFVGHRAKSHLFAPSQSTSKILAKNVCILCIFLSHNLLTNLLFCSTVLFRLILAARPSSTTSRVLLKPLTSILSLPTSIFCPELTWLRQNNLRFLLMITR